MTTGIQFQDSAGNVIYTIGDDISCIVGYVAATHGVSGSVTDATIGSGTPFYFLLGDSTMGGTGSQKSVTFAGNTMSWGGGGYDATIFVGVRNPSFPAPAAGSADFSVLYQGSKRLTRAMAQLVLIGKGSLTPGAGNNTITVSHSNLYYPVIAIRNSSGYAVVRNVSPGGTSTTFTVSCDVGGGTLEWFAFGKVPDSTPSGVGLRLMNDSGNVMFDSRYLMLLPASVGVNYGLANFARSSGVGNGTWPINMPALGGGRKIAVITQDPGFYMYSNAAPGAVNTAELGGVGVNTAGGNVAVMKAVAWGSAPFVVGPFDVRVDSSLVTVDVTNM